MLDLVTFEYTNHKGIDSTRVVRPIRLWFGSTAWHTDAQYLLEAFDLGKLGTRDFAMCNVRNWRVSSKEDVEKYKNQSQIK